MNKPEAVNHAKAKKKASTREAFCATFRFFSYAQSLLNSGAKVKKETENSSVHACVTFILNQLIHVIARLLKA